jgi:putative ATPase
MSLLATQIRPTSLENFIGQEHLVGPNKPLRIALEKEHIFSMIFWGPPGVGKTTLARIIAEAQQREFHELSAVSAGKADIKKIIDSAREQKTLMGNYRAPILFLDEIHRFNKAQQDYLLPYVENGDIVLIGATTENPSFEVNSALLSRSKIFVLKQLAEDDLKKVIAQAVKYLSKTTGTKLKIMAKARDWLVSYANGDARKLLNLLENTFELYNNLDLENLKNTLQSSHLNYDRKGEEHYDTISAFIKSMRASDTDAALYYLARMVEAGEDPKFIARRMVIFASEDIGLAAPTALVVANAVFEAVTKIGYPEAQINLAHGVAYLCKCQKDRSAYDAYFAALADVKKFGNVQIPLEIRNAPTDLMKELEYGIGYEMYPQGKSYLPKKLKGKRYLKK